MPEERLRLTVVLSKAITLRLSQYGIEAVERPETSEYGVRELDCVRRRVGEEQGDRFFPRYDTAPKQRQRKAVALTD